MPRNNGQTSFEDEFLSSIGEDDEDNNGLPEDDLVNEKLDLPEDEQQTEEDDLPPESDSATESVAREPNKPAPTGADDLDPRGFYKEDANRNLIDDKGKVVARAGRERGLFTRMRQELVKAERDGIKLARRLTESAELLRKVWGMYKEEKAKKSYAADHGLSEEETKQVVDLAVLSKADPIAAAKKHLTLLHLNGIDITSLGVPGAVDAKTIASELKAHVDKRLEARDAPKDPAPSPEDVVAQAKQEVYDTLDKYPEAVPYVKFIAEVKNKFPAWSVEKCWLELKSQMQAQDRAATGAVNKQRQQQRQAPPKPNNTRGRRVDTRVRTTPDDAALTYEQIAAEVLRDTKALET